MRTRIMSIKVGSEGRIEPKEAKQRTRKRNDRPADAVAVAKQSERAERRKPKKRKTMKRCTSPSHFAVDPEEEIKYGEDYTLDLPSRERMDTLLRGVAAFYYKPKEAHPNQASVWVDSEYDQTQYPTLDLLMSPVRRPSPRENWSNKEVAIFEAAMCAHPKEFHMIAKLIKTKNTQECVNFYYTFWKGHTHYRVWKHGAPAAAASAATATSSTRNSMPRSSPLVKKTSTTSSATPSPTPASASPASTNPASAAFSAVPAALLAARDDSQHPRIRIVDPKTGAESYFILPPVSDGFDGEDAGGEEELPPGGKKADSDAGSGEGASSSKRYKCCLPSTYVSGSLCHKVFKSTNALGSHLRMTHGLSKAVSSGNNHSVYVEYVE